MSLHVLLLLGAVVCAGMAVRARPLHAALWLAALSALISIVLYRLGAPEVAVIELSVGAGLRLRPACDCVQADLSASFSQDRSWPDLGFSLQVW